MLASFTEQAFAKMMQRALADPVALEHVCSTEMYAPRICEKAELLEDLE